MSIVAVRLETPAIPLYSIFPDEPGGLFWEALEEALWPSRSHEAIRLLMDGSVMADIGGVQALCHTSRSVLWKSSRKCSKHQLSQPSIPSNSNCGQA